MKQVQFLAEDRRGCGPLRRSAGALALRGFWPTDTSTGEDRSEDVLLSLLWDDFRDRHVMVTGGDGFIGSHLVEALVGCGANVRALAWYDKDGSHGWLDESPVRSSVEVWSGDIRDGDFVRALCQNADIVFHLAALISIPHSYESPRSFVETNVLGTLNVLEGCRAAGVRKLVNTSTSEVYGSPESTPIRETHPLRAQSPYSASKIGADKLCEAYARSFEVPVVTLRPFNTYGPRQSGRAIIPTVLSQMLKGVRELRLGNLFPRRDFTYVDDTVDGFLRIANSPLAAGEVVQLGTGVSVSIAELVSLCSEVTGVEVEIEQQPERFRPEASEVDVLLSDPEVAGRELHWEPRVDLREGLSRVAQWLSNRLDEYPSERYQK